uniref:Uncharacterized protein n=1 Tax=Panagrolaimus sp. JU765 TaxID=591449 RepID=A0AC34QB07_9BILA
MVRNSGIEGILNIKSQTRRKRPTDLQNSVFDCHQSVGLQTSCHIQIKDTLIDFFKDARTKMKEAAASGSLPPSK